MIGEKTKNQTVCFTGHRPEKLRRSESEIKSDLHEAVLQAIRCGKNIFVSGMARGVDIWAAEFVLELKEKGTPIKLVCACPYNGFELNWAQDWKTRYRRVLSKADYVCFLHKKYNPACFQFRNEWMVDRSAEVIAVFNGKKSGTKNTIDYAKKVDIPIVLVDA